jgi:hypothetical protein
MKKRSYFLASADLAERAGVRETRYRTNDGKYILSEKDLKMVQFSMTPNEFINGLDATILTDLELRELIQKSTVGIINVQLDGQLKGINVSNEEYVEEDDYGIPVEDNPEEPVDTEQEEPEAAEEEETEEVITETKKRR